jgi:SAM-dependent methyltransferase
LQQRFQHEERLGACDLCGGPNLATIDRVAQVQECGTCGYRFVNPRPTQAAIAAAYSDPHAYDHWLQQDAGRAVMWSRRLRFVDSLEAPGRRLLDVGAGIGTFLAMARAEGWEVAGTEVSASASELARDRYGIDLRLGQLDELTVPDGSFDAVTLWHVLEHVPSPRSVLTACHRLLVTSGVLVVAVPNDSDALLLPRRVKRVFQRLPYQRYEPLSPGEEVHLSHFRPDVLRRLLGASGVEPGKIGIDNHYGEPRAWTDFRVALTRRLASTTGLNLGNSLLVAARRR